MSNVQHPYDDEEIAYRRAWPSIHDIDSRNADMRNERDRWLATYDALSARVAKLEAALREMVEAVDGAARPTCGDHECAGSCVIEAKEKARAALEEPK